MSGHDVAGEAEGGARAEERRKGRAGGRAWQEQAQRLPSWASPEGMASPQSSEEAGSGVT